MLCWLGGTLEFGEPCSDSYECSLGLACNATGVCSYACDFPGEPCRTLHEHVCRDGVCTPVEG